jgi:hypothetical protein
MFKRALADAVSSGKEWIGWTTGETQAARYDLSKQIDVLRYSEGGNDPSNPVYNLTVMPKGPRGEWTRLASGITKDKLSEYVGKDLAEKIAKGEGEVDSFTKQKDIRGADLRIGGEGMKGFYDQILPKEISKYVKQWGGQVEKSMLTAPKGKPTQYEDFSAYVAAPEKTKTPIWRVNITPQMREGIKKAGQALFVGGMAAVVAEQEEQ